MKPFMTCQYCKHGIYEEDLSVGIPGGYDCDNPCIPEEIYDSEDFGAENQDCKFFEPVIHEKCDVCGRTMNVPMWLWDKIFHGAYGDYVCCCQECIDEQRSREDAEFARNDHLEKKLSDTGEG